MRMSLKLNFKPQFSDKAMCFWALFLPVEHRSYNKVFKNSYEILSQKSSSPHVSRKGPVVGKGMLDFIEDIFVGVN